MSAGGSITCFVIARDMDVVSTISCLAETGGCGTI